MDRLYIKDLNPLCITHSFFIFILILILILILIFDFFSGERFWFLIFFFRRNCDPLFQLLNNTLKLEESIPDYYNGQVLLRSSPNYPQTFSGELRFQTLFHIIVIWMSVFIGLSKGLKSYGKVVYIFSIASLLGFSVFAIKVIGTVHIFRKQF